LCDARHMVAREKCRLGGASGATRRSVSSAAGEKKESADSKDEEALTTARRVPSFSLGALRVSFARDEVARSLTKYPYVLPCAYSAAAMAARIFSIFSGESTCPSPLSLECTMVPLMSTSNAPEEVGVGAPDVSVLGNLALMAFSTALHLGA
jgi:hypothetical protein